MPGIATGLDPLRYGLFIASALSCLSIRLLNSDVNFLPKDAIRTLLSDAEEGDSSLPCYSYRMLGFGLRVVTTQSVSANIPNKQVCFLQPPILGCYLLRHAVSPGTLKRKTWLASDESFRNRTWDHHQDLCCCGCFTGT